MKIKKLNKKGVFHAEIIAQFFSYVALILVIIVFLALFRGCTNKAIEQNIISQASNLEANTNLLNYLRTPIIMVSGEGDVADLIHQYYISDFKDKKLEEKIREKTNSFFTDFEYCYKESKITDWMVRGACIFISTDPNEKLEGSLMKRNRKVCTENFESSIIDSDAVIEIPTKDLKFIYVHLYYSSHNIGSGKKCTRYII